MLELEQPFLKFKSLINFNERIEVLFSSVTSRTLGNVLQNEDHPGGIGTGTLGV
jgi:hypothetical protein